MTFTETRNQGCVQQLVLPASGPMLSPLAHLTLLLASIGPHYGVGSHCSSETETTN